MVRLSKPTAASQARMAAAAPATPPRGTAATSRTPAVKPKAATPASPKKPAKKEPLLLPASAELDGSAVAASGAAKSQQDSDVGDKSEIVDLTGSRSPTAIVEAKSEQVQDDILTEPVEEETDNAGFEEAVVEAKSEQVQDDVLTEPVEEETDNAGFEDNEAMPTSPTFEPTEITEVTAPDEEEPTATHDTKDDLEDIVNLLESVSITKPLNDTITIPDEILEIPDEDEK